MIWLILILVFFLMLLLLLFSNVKIGLFYKREDNNDRIKIEIGLLNGLIPIRLKIPGLKATEHGVEFNEKVQGYGKNLNKEKRNISIKDLKIYHEKIQELLERIVGLQKIMKQFMAKIKIVKFSWWSRIGTGDAAETGVLSGIVWGIKGGIVMLLSHFMSLRSKPAIQIEPSFIQACLYTEFECIVQFRIGNAILAGIRMFIHLRKGRKVRWENTQFRD